MQTLYETVDALAVVRMWMDEHDDEIRANEGALPDELAALLDQAEGDFKTKLQRVALFIRELDHWAKIAKAEKDRFSARQTAFENRVKRLKDFYLKPQLERAEVERVECELLTVRLQKNGQASVAHTLTPEALWNMGSRYAVKIVTQAHRHGQETSESVTYSADNEAIRSDYKAGLVSDEDLAAVGISATTGKHVRIQ